MWVGQGMGYIGGSSMTDQDEWAFIGAITAGLGVALFIVMIQNARRKDG